jgi:5-methylcytosine-specific restriction endonuclease McrA
MATVTRVCSVGGCEGAHRARGLCSKHWKQQHGAPTRYLVVCAWCGADHLSARKDGIACSNTHKMLVLSYRKNGPASSAVPITHACRTADREAARWAGREGATSRVRYGHCAVCTRLYVARFTTSTCGTACAETKRQDDKRESKHRRRAVQRDAFVAPVSRREIYARDRYTCQLCCGALAMGETVPHPDAPTIDHVIPLAKGGTHEPANVQAAHFRCNSVKGARDYTV